MGRRTRAVALTISPGTRIRVRRLLNRCGAVLEVSDLGSLGHFVDLDEMQRSVWSEPPRSNDDPRANWGLGG